MTFALCPSRPDPSSTTLSNQTLNPEWNQTFKMRLDSAQRQENLVLHCFDHDVLTLNNSLGMLEIPLNSLVVKQQYQQIHPLKQSPEKVGKGELELCYRLLPRNHSRTPAVLYITVIRAKDLLAADRGGTSDPYVRLHIGEDVRGAKRSKIRRKTLNPEFQQSFKFRLDADQRQEDLTIECFDYDMLGSDDSLGKVLLSVDMLRTNEEVVDWFKLRQDEGSVGEIELRYRLVERTATQLDAEEDMLKPGTLTLSVVRARDLLPADSNGLSDPYVQMHVGNAVDRAEKTKVIKKSLSPEWNETFVFELDRAQRLEYLTLECFDWDRLSANDSLGVVELDLDSLVHNQECVEWYKLIQEGETEDCGELEIKYVFVPSDNDDEPQKKSGVHKDRIPVATSAVRLGPANLKFTVLSGKGLLAADRSGTSDPYVRLSLGLMKTRTFTTKVMKRTLNPVWDETFNVRLDSYSADDKLEMECFDYDVLGSDDSLGKCTISLGSIATDQEFTEWCSLTQDSGSHGQIEVRYKLQSDPDLPVTNTDRKSVNDMIAPNTLSAAEDEELRQLEDARERMALNSCSLFRLVRHPLMLPAANDSDPGRALQRQRTMQLSCSTALTEIRVALREGNAKFAHARALLARGHFQDAIKEVQLSKMCYEYADGIEREANVFFQMESNLVILDESTKDEQCKLDQIQQLDADIDTAFKDSMRGVWPLHKAASTGAIGTVSYLIRRFGERVDSIDRAGKTALHVAVENGHLDLARTLIHDFGANPAHRTFTGRTPIHLASDSGDEIMVRGLFECCASRITTDIAKGLRSRMTNEQISNEALGVLGTWDISEHGNTAIKLAANKLHVVCYPFIPFHIHLVMNS